MAENSELKLDLKKTLLFKVAQMQLVTTSKFGSG